MGKERFHIAAADQFGDCGLKNLKAGRYYFIEHPGMNTPEMQAIGHPGYEDVAIDREAVTHVFTSREVMDMIREKGIFLVSYEGAARLKQTGRGQVLWIESAASQEWHERSIIPEHIRDQKVDAVMQTNVLKQQVEGFGACFNELGWKSLQILRQRNVNPFLRTFLIR